MTSNMSYRKQTVCLRKVAVFAWMHLITRNAGGMTYDFLGE